MNLREAGVREPGPALMRAPSRRTIGVHGIGRQIKNVAVTTAAEQHGMCEVTLKFTGDEVLCDDAASFSIDDDELYHFMAGVHLHCAFGDLTLERTICAQQ